MNTWVYDDCFGRHQIVLAEVGRERMVLRDHSRFDGKTSLRREYRRNGKWLVMESVTIDWTSKKKPEVYIWDGEKVRCGYSRSHVLEAIRSIGEDLLPIPSINRVVIMIISEFGALLDSRTKY